MGAQRTTTAQTTSLLDVADEVNMARNIVECLLMASGAMNREEGGAIAAVSSIAVDRLIRANEMLASIMREAKR